MNRRSFLVRLGQAATAAAALTLVPDVVGEALDPERALWVPGQKTIIDFGATKNVEAATDRDVIGLKMRELLANPGLGGKARTVLHDHTRELTKDRDIKLEIFTDGQHGTFRYKGDTLVSVHSAKELALLDVPFGGIRKVNR